MKKQNEVATVAAAVNNEVSATVVTVIVAMRFSMLFLIIVFLFCGVCIHQCT